MYQALLLDFDGTILDTERHNLVAWQEAAIQVGISITGEFYQTLIGLTKSDSDVLFRRHFGEDSPVDHWRGLRRAAFYRLWDEGRGPAWKPGLDTLLAELERRSFKRAIASSSLRFELDHKLERAGLLQHFPVRVSGDDVAAGKPSPDVFLQAARLLAVKPRHCLVVEDSPLGVQAARRAGMDVVFVPDMVEADENVRQASLAVVPSLADVIGLMGG